MVLILSRDPVGLFYNPNWLGCHFPDFKIFPILCKHFATIKWSTLIFQLVPQWAELRSSLKNACQTKYLNSCGQLMHDVFFQVKCTVSWTLQSIHTSFGFQLDHLDRLHRLSSLNSTAVFLGIASRICSKQHVILLCSSYQAFSPCVFSASMWCIHTVVLTQTQNSYFILKDRSVFGNILV